MKVKRTAIEIPATKSQLKKNTEFPLAVFFAFHRAILLNNFFLEKLETVSADTKPRRSGDENDHWLA